MVSHAMQVLRLFGPERPDLGVVEAAELLGKPKSTTSRWLRSMEEAGFLVRDGTAGRFRLSLVLAALGEVARQSTSIQQLGRPVLEALVADTEETSNLVVLDGDAGVNVEVVRSPRTVQHVGLPGRRLPLHATAAGKVLLAWLPESRREAVLPPELRAWAPRTITDRKALERELARVRRNGYATASGELEEDLAAASAPARDHRGSVVAAVTVSGPTSRIPPETLDEFGSRVRRAADELSWALGYREGR